MLQQQWSLSTNFFLKKKMMQQKEEKKTLPLTIGLDAYLDFGVEVDLVMVPCY
jgi:hypothetical protein